MADRCIRRILEVGRSIIRSLLFSRSDQEQEQQYCRSPDFGDLLKDKSSTKFDHWHASGLAAATNGSLVSGSVVVQTERSETSDRLLSRSTKEPIAAEASQLIPPRSPLRSRKERRDRRKEEQFFDQ